MVHNGIEYGIMAAYSEGLNILRHANAGKQAEGAGDAETAPLRHPEHYQYHLNLADIAETWRHGSVIGPWLLDLTGGRAREELRSQRLCGTRIRLGRRTVDPQGRHRRGRTRAGPEHRADTTLSSRGDEDFANKLLSAMRYGFGGHEEKHS